MKKIGIVVHGGASIETPFLIKNKKEYSEGLREAVSIGYKILKRGGNALNAVEKTVIYLEDNALFNAGRGSALNNKGEIEMDASIMEGKDLNAGAVCMVRNIKNPIHLAKVVMSKTKHVLLSSHGAIDLAKASDFVLEPDSYFMTQHQYDEFLSALKELPIKKLQKKSSGTVGAVAVDEKGNLAAATSTGGTSHCLPGRIGDSCIIGAGCYANNSTCAVSGTGEGEKLIRGVVAHTISMFIELKKFSIQEACDYVIRDRNKNSDIGVIAIDKNANIGIAFNTNIMKCGWMRASQTDIAVRIFKHEFEKRGDPSE